MPKRKMLINTVPGEECRIAIVEDGRLEELYQERASSGSIVGNIYKGRVTNVEPSIQAAFVDFGLERNGFLHISDIHPQYFPGDSKEDSERVGQKTPRRERPPIQKCLRRGQDILVQVLKDGIGTKGPTLTSYLSIPGRFIVMMPHMERLGVSRKIEDDQIRREMRKTLDELNPPKGFGFIIRTAGLGRPKAELKRDLAYLQRLWKAIDQRMAQTQKVGELYAESDLLIRTIRDVFTTDIEQIIVDDPAVARRARNFLAIANPRSASKVMVYTDTVPLYHKFSVEEEIELINARQVPLPSGGSIVIDSTEALVAIDVNSGKNRDNADAESTAYKTNIEAVDEICRQLRLRDLGGVVVLDLIDMYTQKHRRDIEQRLRNNLKKDRARTHFLAISQFGIVEMTRQRMRPSLKSSLYSDCTHCNGAGQVKSTESVVLDVMRRLAWVMNRKDVSRVELTVSPDVAFHLLNRTRGRLVQLEADHEKPVTVRVGGNSIDYLRLTLFNAQGGELNPDAASSNKKPTLVTVDEWEKTHKEQAEAMAAEELDTSTDDELATPDVAPEEPSTDINASDDAKPADDTPKKPRRRRRRRSSRSSADKQAAETAENTKTTDPTDKSSTKSKTSTAKSQPANKTRPKTSATSSGNSKSSPENSNRQRSRGGTNATTSNSDTKKPSDAKPSQSSRRRRSRSRSSKPDQPKPEVVAKPQTVTASKGYSNRLIQPTSDPEPSTA